MKVKREFCNGYGVEIELTHDELEDAEKELRKERDNMCYLVYEVNDIHSFGIDPMVEEEMILFTTKEAAYAEVEKRKHFYMECETNGFTYMPEESSEDCAIFAEGLMEDGISREGEFQIRAKGLYVWKQ